MQLQSINIWLPRPLNPLIRLKPSSSGSGVLENPDHLHVVTGSWETTLKGQGPFCNGSTIHRPFYSDQLTDPIDPAGTQQIVIDPALHHWRFVFSLFTVLLYSSSRHVDELRVSIVRFNAPVLFFLSFNQRRHRPSLSHGKKMQRSE